MCIGAERLAANRLVALESFGAYWYLIRELAMLRVIPRALRLIATRPGRAILVLRMAFWVTILSIAVRWYSLPRALSMVAAPGASKFSQDEAEAEELATAIDALLGLNVLAFKPVCWKRAAILHRYLNLRGRATLINFGVRRGVDGKLDGHAWVEADGKPIQEGQILDYTVTYVFPSNAPFDMELGSLANTNPLENQAS